MVKKRDCAVCDVRRGGPCLASVVLVLQVEAVPGRREERLAGAVRALALQALRGLGRTWGGGGEGGGGGGARGGKGGEGPWVSNGGKAACLAL